MRSATLLRTSLALSLIALGGCQPAPASPTPPATTAPPAGATPPSPTEFPPTPTPRLARSIDLVAHAPADQGEWFSADIDTLPEAAVVPETRVVLTGTAVDNRRDGQISPVLAARYVFLQFGDIRADLLELHASTVRALFIRSALMSFVDYLGGRVLDWDGRSSQIPLDLEEIIGLCNRLGIPVYLELNYSGYIPGQIGTGVDELVPADNLTRTIEYLKALEADGLQVAGLTFGDEIGDDAGFGDRKPSLATSDVAAAYIAYARGLKTAFPQLAIYAFDSEIGAAEGQGWTYFDLFERIRAAELEDGRPLIDGFLFRESYVYLSAEGTLQSSQRILADTDSLAKDSPVYRYDSRGRAHDEADRDYLHTLLEQTESIFGRPLEIGLSEYLPAGPTTSSESDTSPYADIDFTLHYADVMGIYATLGLDLVSTWMFANSTDQAKCYLDRQGLEGANYPVHRQIAEELRGEMVQPTREPADAARRLRIYAASHDGRLFVMLLNRDVEEQATVRIVVPGELDLAIRLPARSYTSLVLQGDQVVVSSIGG